ncbi:MAG TPA: hypothetical protein VN231_02650 [Allosphingosinicella sp.]|nr:hypothetical protein [Allosphingosinicella sp.]
MSRRRATHPRRPPARILGGWTLQRASGVGASAGLAAILIAGLFNTSPSGLLYPYAGLLALTALCGASILWITATDMRTRGTSGRMRPIRGFDAALGLVLLVPSVYALVRIWPELGL